MNIRTCIALSLPFASLVLIGCSPRQLPEAGLPYEVPSANTSASLPDTDDAGTGSDTVPDLGAALPDSTDELGAAQGLEGSQVVDLTFTDDYTGFWRNDTRPEALGTQILRITFGETLYHIDEFEDQSTGEGSQGFNCYVKANNITRELVDDGLWLIVGTDTDGWQLNGETLEYVYYNNGELLEYLSQSYTRVFDGLAVDGLQICE